VSDPYVGEIRMFGGNFAPNGWAFCAGQLLPISEYETLFNLIGTTYGGDGQTTFALPDLRGRVPIHQGTGTGLSTRVIGELGSTESVTLTAQQIPAHSHAALGTTANATATSPTGATWGAWPDNQYADPGATVAMAPSAIAPTGGSQPHDNLAPALTISFIISFFGIFPSPS